MIVVIGYGNPLRCDDAIGQYLALAMEQQLGGDAFKVRTVHQLTPELVISISDADLVVFIDARVGDPPGDVRFERVERQPSAGAFTHNVTPASLISAAWELYGIVPVGVLISVAGATFDFGTEFSQPIQRRMPALVAEVKAIIEASAKSIMMETAHA